MSEHLAIPHTGTRPAWLEDDAILCNRQQNNAGSYAKHVQWHLRGEWSLLPNHWAAPVLKAGLTPWNPLLQGDRPPADYAGGKVMWRMGGEITCTADRWRDELDIVGYERAEPQYAAGREALAWEKLANDPRRPDLRADALNQAELWRNKEIGSPPPSTEALLEKAVEALRTYSKVHGVLTNYDRERLQATLAEIERELGR